MEISHWNVKVIMLMKSLSWPAPEVPLQPVMRVSTTWCHFSGMMLTEAPQSYSCWAIYNRHDDSIGTSVTWILIMLHVHHILPLDSQVSEAWWGVKSGVNHLNSGLVQERCNSSAAGNGVTTFLHLPIQGLKLTLISRSNFLLLLSKSWSKSDRHRSYFLSLKADIWLDWVAKLCS